MPADVPRPVPGSTALPAGFTHPHASEEARAIAENGVILRVQVGSGVHGTSITGQDALPAQPDRRWVDDWLHRSYLGFWARSR
jgi:hypothetical protein